MNEHRVVTAELRRHDFQITGEAQLIRGYVYSDPRYRDGEFVRSKEPVDRIEGDLVFCGAEIFRIIN